jgi:hypothetical protein
MHTDDFLHAHLLNAHVDHTDTRVRRVLIECGGCGYIDELTGVTRENVFGRARDLLAEHRLARGCRGSDWRIEAVALDSDLGRLPAREVMLEIAVDELLGEALR